MRTQDEKVDERAAMGLKCLQGRVWKLAYGCRYSVPQMRYSLDFASLKAVEDSWVARAAGT